MFLCAAQFFKFIRLDVFFFLFPNANFAYNMLLWVVLRIAAILFSASAAAYWIAVLAVSQGVTHFTHHSVYFALYFIFTVSFLERARLHCHSLHQVHHEFKSSISIAAEYAHPVEQMIGNYIPVLVAPILLQVSLPVWLTW